MLSRWTWNCDALLKYERLLLENIWMFHNYIFLCWFFKKWHTFNTIVYYHCVLKEMKMLDKEARVWDIYMGLESVVKNLLTSLRAVNELQNSAIRERHWQQLMNTTGVWEYICFLWEVFIYCLYMNLFSKFSQPIYPDGNWGPTPSITVFFLIFRSGLWWERAPPWGTCWNYSFTV